MLKISFPSSMVSEVFLECQQSTPGFVRHRACSAVTVTWHFKLCLDDQLGHIPVFLNHVAPAVLIRDWIRSSLQFPHHTWIANNIIIAPTWSRDVAQAWGAESSQICNKSRYRGILPDLFLHALKNAETFLSDTSQKMSASGLL